MNKLYFFAGYSNRFVGFMAVFLILPELLWNYERMVASSFNLVGILQMMNVSLSFFVVGFFGIIFRREGRTKTIEGGLAGSLLVLLIQIDDNMKKKFSIIDGGSENNKEKFRTVVANNSDDTTVVSSTTATKFTRVRNLFIFIWVFFLAVWSAPILNETIRSLEAKDTRESLLLVLIFVSKVQQTSYCIAGATQMCYVLQLVDLQSKRLQILVLKDAGNVCLLNAHMVEELVVSATNFLQDTKEVCKSLQGVTIFYLVYVFIAIVQVGAGIASAWVADETAGGEKLLVPFFLVQVVFGTGAIFASLMMR